MGCSDLAFFYLYQCFDYLFMTDNVPSTDAGKAREGLIDELETINNYEEMASETSDPKLKAQFEEITDDERVHVGNFATMISEHDPKAEPKMREGLEESKKVRKMFSFRDMMCGASHFQKAGSLIDHDNTYDRAMQILQNQNRKGYMKPPKLRPSMNYYGMNRGGSVSKRMYIRSRLQMMHDIAMGAAEPLTAELIGMDISGIPLDRWGRSKPFKMGGEYGDQEFKIKRSRDGKHYILAKDDFKQAFTPLIRKYRRWGGYTDVLATPKTTEHVRKGEDTRLVTEPIAIYETNRAWDTGRVVGVRERRGPDQRDPYADPNNPEDKFDFNSYIESMEDPDINDYFEIDPETGEYRPKDPNMEFYEVNPTVEYNSRNQALLKERPELRALDALRQLLTKGNKVKMREALGEEGYRDYVMDLADKILSDEEYRNAVDGAIVEGKPYNPAIETNRVSDAVSNALLERLPDIVQDDFLVDNLLDDIRNRSTDTTNTVRTKSGKVLPGESRFGALFGNVLNNSVQAGHKVPDREIQRGYASVFSPNRRKFMLNGKEVSAPGTNETLRDVARRKKDYERRATQNYRNHKGTSYNEATKTEILTPEKFKDKASGTGVSTDRFGNEGIPYFHWIDQLISASRDNDEKAYRIAQNRLLRDDIFKRATLRQRNKLLSAIEDARKASAEAVNNLKAQEIPEEDKQKKINEELKRVWEDVYSTAHSFGNMEPSKLTSPEVYGNSRGKNPYVHYEDIRIGPAKEVYQLQTMDDVANLIKESKNTGLTPQEYARVVTGRWALGIPDDSVDETSADILLDYKITAPDRSFKEKMAQNRDYNEKFLRDMWDKDHAKSVEKQKERVYQYLGLIPAKLNQDSIFSPSLSSESYNESDWDMLFKNTDDKALNGLLTGIHADELRELANMAASRGMLNDIAFDALKGRGILTNVNLQNRKFPRKVAQDGLENGISGPGKLNEIEEKTGVPLTDATSLKGFAADETAKDILNKLNGENPEQTVVNKPEEEQTMGEETQTPSDTPTKETSEEKGQTMGEETQNTQETSAEKTPNKKETVQMKLDSFGKVAGFKEMLKSANEKQWKERGLPPGNMVATLPAYYRTVTMGEDREAINVYEHKKMPVGGKGITVKTITGIGPKYKKGE